MGAHDLLVELQARVDKLEASGNSQNIYGECYKEGQIDAYKEIIKMLEQSQSERRMKMDKKDDSAVDIPFKCKCGSDLNALIGWWTEHDFVHCECGRVWSIACLEPDIDFE